MVHCGRLLTSLAAKPCCGQKNLFGSSSRRPRPQRKLSFGIFPVPMTSPCSVTHSSAFGDVTLTSHCCACMTLAKHNVMQIDRPALNKLRISSSSFIPELLINDEL